MTIYKEIMILSVVLLIVLLSVKVVYGLPTTLEEVQNEEGKSQTDRSQLESYIFNHNISIGLSDENKTAFNASADWIPLEKLVQFANTELLQITVREHMQRCGVENKGDMINYTISNQPDIEFPNRSGIC
ncbi:MAG: hypothetical protein WA393_12955 [Nitrososphaeraceae archaeon]